MPQGPLGPRKLCICKFLWIIGMFYIKIDPSNREPHWNTSYYEIGMLRDPPGSLKGALGPPKGLWGPINCVFVNS